MLKNSVFCDASQLVRYLNLIIFLPRINRGVKIPRTSREVKISHTSHEVKHTPLNSWGKKTSHKSWCKNTSHQSWCKNTSHKSCEVKIHHILWGIFTSCLCNIILWDIFISRLMWGFYFFTSQSEWKILYHNLNSMTNSIADWAKTHVFTPNLMKDSQYFFTSHVWGKKNN